MFINEILEIDNTKSYLWKEIKVGRVVTQNLNKSAAISLFQKKSHSFHPHFGLLAQDETDFML